MSEFGSAAPEFSPALWPRTGATPSAPVQPTLPRTAIVLMVSLVSLVFLLGMILHLEVSAALKLQNASPTALVPAGQGVATLEKLRRWQLTTTLCTTGCGVILIGFSVVAARRLDARRDQALEKQNESWRKATDELRVQLADKLKFEMGLREQHHLLQDQLKAVSRAYAEAKQELDQFKLTKEVYVHQRRELIRSRDVLELNVQARTHQLQKLQRAYESILNSAGEGICGLDTEGIVTFANPAAARMIGLQINEIVGQPARKVFPQFVDGGVPENAEAGTANPVEVTATRYNGSKFGAEYLRSPIREDNRLVGEVLLFKDITDRKLVADKLTQKAEELTRSNKELEQFAFVASHDLQEPLRKIQAFGDRLKARCDAVNLQDGRDYLDRMQSAAARMQTLIYDLLTFSRVISRTEPFGPINLNTVVKDIISDLEVSIEKTSGRVEVGELPTIEADGTQMRQLLQNLIGNALKFHAPGKAPIVRVAARTIAAPVTPTGNQNSGTPAEWTEITIADNGIGFDEKYLDRIFAVFQRLHGRQEYEGTGIGLAVCRRIVDRHAGSITARSVPGEGATFIINLPLRQPIKPEAQT